MDANAKDLITKLLIKVPGDRLGANDIEEVKQHPFFKGVDFFTIREQIVPISLPNVIKSS
jgi:serine/threonine-protein kinase RIM15